MAVLEQALDEMEILADSSTAPDIKPSQLREENWEDWYQEFLAYLSHVTGKQRVPLDYLVQIEPPPGGPGMLAPREMELYSYPLSGPYFREDNKEVFRLLSDRIKDQPATWIQPFQASQNGRGAWLALIQHYDGGGMKEKRINKAELVLSSLFYNNKRVFSFDVYAANMLRAFCTLESTQNRHTPGNQTKLLLDNIRLNTADIAVIKGYVCMHYWSDPGRAIEYISREISELFPNVLDHSRRTGRNRYISAMDSGHDSNRARNFDGLQQNDGVFTLYGVDVTDIHRKFSSQEMTPLGPRGQAYIYQERATAVVAAETRAGAVVAAVDTAAGDEGGVALRQFPERRTTPPLPPNRQSPRPQQQQPRHRQRTGEGEMDGFSGPAITTKTIQPRRDAGTGRPGPRKW